VNKVTLIGNLGNDPEIKTIASGSKVATFTLATSTAWNNANGEKQEKTEWHRCVAWNGKTSGMGLADIVEKYVKKGDKLFVEGSIEYRQWQDKENQTRYMTEIKVRELVMLGGGSGGGGRGDFDSDDSRSRAPARNAGRSAAASSTKDNNFDDFPSALEDQDDDLPF